MQKTVVARVFSGFTASPNIKGRHNIEVVAMLHSQYLSIDIGNTNVKMVFGNYHKGAVRIIEYAIVKTPKNAINDGKIVDIRGLVSIIKDTIKNLNIRCKSLILQVTGTGVITREIQLPVSTADEIEKMLDYEAQQYFPVDLESYTLDYKVLEKIENEEGNFYRLLLVAVPEKQADEYMKIAQELHMEMAAIDIPANCILKMIYGQTVTVNALKQVNHKTTAHEYAVLDVGSHTTGVCIFNQGNLKFNRILLTGSNILDEFISSEYEIPSDEAEQRKTGIDKVVLEENEPFMEAEQARLNRCIRNGIDNLVNDLSRFFDFYNSRGSANRLQKIYICGGGSKLAGLNEYLYSVFNISTEYLEKEERISYDGKKAQTTFDKDFSFLANAIGALVRQ